jgi:hypothetical protein
LKSIDTEIFSESLTQENQFTRLALLNLVLGCGNFLGYSPVSTLNLALLRRFQQTMSPLPEDMCPAGFHLALVLFGKCPELSSTKIPESARYEHDKKTRDVERLSPIGAREIRVVASLSSTPRK